MGISLSFLRERVTELLDVRVDRSAFGSLKMRVKSSMNEVVIIFLTTNLTVIGVGVSLLQSL